MQKKTIDIQKLLVNPENPRFEPVENQAAALELMLSEAGDEVINLARDISLNGLNPSKRLMVIAAKGDKYLPLEGNRRIVALRTLKDPKLVKNKSLKEKIEKIKKESTKKIPGQVECIVFPDKESAVHWVSLEHTGKNKGVGVLKWTRVELQRFLAQITQKPLSRDVQLIDFAKENKLNNRKVDPSTLDRIASTPYVCKQLGISFPKGVLKLTKPKKQVMNGLQRVLDAMSTADFKVRDVYTAAQRETWIVDVLGTNGKTAKSSTESSKKEDEQAAKKKSDPLDGDWITHGLFQKYAKKNRIKAILKELKDLDPNQKPNVCASSLRVLFELAIYVFLEEKGIIKKLIKEEKDSLAKRNKTRKVKVEWKKDWSPSLSKMLKYIATSDDLISDPNKRRALSTFIGKKSTEPFLEELNLFIHNPDYEPSPANVFEIWKKLGKPLFRAILS